MVLKTDNNESVDIIRFALAYASRKFMEQSAAKNEKVVVWRNGAVAHVPAAEMLEEQQSNAKMNQLLKDGAAKYLRNEDILTPTI
jgi:hypothetical protein